MAWWIRDKLVDEFKELCEQQGSEFTFEEFNAWLEERQATCDHEWVVTEDTLLSNYWGGGYTTEVHCVKCLAGHVHRSTKENYSDRCIDAVIEASEKKGGRPHEWEHPDAYELWVQERKQ